MNTRGILHAILLIAASAGLSFAGNPKSINETRPASATGKVVVENIAGSVTVTGWDRNEVSVTGTMPEDCTLEFTGGGERTSVVIKWPKKLLRNIHDDDGCELKVQIPKQGGLGVQTVSADINASGIRGEVSLESVSGDVEVRDDPKNVEATSVSGDVKITARTKSIKAESVSGSLIIDGPEGSSSLSSTSGEISLRGGVFEQIEASTVSGDLQIDCTIAPEGHFDLSSHSGSIELILPADVSADFALETFSGDIESDFGTAPKRNRHHTPGRDREFSTGSGSAQIEVSTFSGEVSLRKK